MLYTICCCHSCQLLWIFGSNYSEKVFPTFSIAIIYNKKRSWRFLYRITGTANNNRWQLYLSLMYWKLKCDFELFFLRQDKSKMLINPMNITKQFWTCGHENCAPMYNWFYHKYGHVHLWVILNQPSLCVGEWPEAPTRKR